LFRHLDRRLVMMRRIVLGLVVIAGVLLWANGSPGTVALGKELGVAARTAASVAPSVSQTGGDNGDTIVYITKTGKKYHTAGCSSLSKSKIPIKLADAVARGYGACLNCKPPVLTQTGSASTSAAPPDTSQARSAQKPSAGNGDTIVYITKTGKKYHTAGCRSLSKSKIAIKLADAVARGYGVCSICKPPALTQK
jgi:hypothetical protein